MLNFTDSTLPSVLSVETLLYDVSYVRRAQFALLMVNDAANLQARRSRIQQNIQKVDNAFHAYEATVGADHERQVFNQAKQQWLSYQRAVNKLINCWYKDNKSKPRHSYLPRMLLLVLWSGQFML